MRLTRRILIAAVVATLFWTIVIVLFENSFIFFPARYPSGPYDEMRSIPALSEQSFRTEDGLLLHGVYVPSDSAVATILFAHGNAGNLSHRLHWIRAMSPLRANIFLFDYRGYGKSEGSPDEQGVYADARAAYDHLMTIDSPDRSPVVFWGRSLGGAVVAHLATERRTDGVILESTFTSARDMAAELYPFLPFAGRLISTRLDAATELRSVIVPTLHIHGSRDDIVPPKLGKALYQSAQGEKTLYIIEGAGHNDTYMVGGADYLSRIAEYLTSLHPPD